MALSLFIFSCAGKENYAMPDLKKEETNFKRVVPTTESVQVKKIRGFIFVEDGLNTMRDKTIEFKMDCPLTIPEFFEVMLYQGINVATRLTPKEEQNQNVTDQNKASKKEPVTEKKEDRIYINHYSGSLKRLLKRIQMSYGLFYDYADSMLIVKEISPVYVKVIMPGLEEQLIELIKSFGIDNAFYDSLSNRVIFESDYFRYAKIKDYFKNNNYLTLINFDVLVLESEIEKSKENGIDWSKFSFSLEQLMDNTANLAIDKAAGDGSYSFSFGWDILSASGFYANIQDFSELKIVQSARISSINGTECILDVSEKIPYVSEVNLSSLNDASDTVVQGYEFDTANSGIVLTLKPNVVDNFVTVSFKAEIQNITDFLEVGAENKYSQPVVSVRNINNDLILIPGRIQLVGGLKYKKGNNRKTGLIDVSEKLGLRSASEREFFLTVLLRSEIIKYVFV